MRDKKLQIFISLAALFFLAHTVDHVARDLRWPLTAEAIPFLAATGAILIVVFGALYLTRRGKIGRAFLGDFRRHRPGSRRLGHFSPFTEQPVSYIFNFNAYRSPIARWLAVGSLLAVMPSLAATTIYAGMLWARGPR